MQREEWATNGYAVVAAANPYGLTAMRVRGVRYVWATLGVLVLAVMYAAPVVAVFRQPALPGRTTPLPNLAFPNVALPILRVPTLHPLAPVPAAPPAAHHSTALHALAPTKTRKVARRTTVPVVSDTHTQVAPTAAAKKSAPKDPFANVPTVSDEVGVVVALPTQQTPASSAPAAPDTTAPTAAPDAQPATSPDFDATDFLTPATALPRAGSTRVLTQFDATDPGAGASAPAPTQSSDPAVVKSTTGAPNTITASDSSSTPAGSSNVAVGG